MESELQRQASALQASGFRGSSLARALMGAQMGATMNLEQAMANANAQEQLLREQVAQARYGLLMGLRGGLQEQAIKGGALAVENALQSEQLASQQMMGLMQGIGSLAGAYAQYRQQQEMLRTLQGLFQQPHSTPAMGFGVMGLPYGGQTYIPFQR
jgi:hypothetical protein